MNKKLVAALVAGAFAAPIAAQADTNTVTLYGMAQVAASYWDDGVTSGHGLEDTGSRVGFKGEEQLGGGLKAFFQIESGLSLDQGGGTFASREGWVGLNGNFGTVKLGRGKTYFDLAQETFDGFNANSTMINALLIDGASYRLNNVIAYESPELYGLSAKVQYGDMEGKGAGVKPRVFTGSLQYQNGPLMVMGAAEDQKDTTGVAATNQTDTVTAVKGMKVQNYLLGASYTLPFGTALSAAYRHSEQTPGENTSKQKRDVFTATIGQPFGNVNVHVGYVHAGDLKGCDDGACFSGGAYKAGTYTASKKGADYYIGAVEYNFSKRTWVYLEHATADNKDDSGLFATSLNTKATAVNGKDNNTTSLGIIHLF